MKPIETIPAGEVWFSYTTAEFNVRYRDAAGDDGLRADWAALRDRWAEIYASGTQPPPELANDLYLERERIEKLEPVADMQIIRDCNRELQESVNAGTFPPKAAA
jgi:hypothetical protein